MKQGPNWFAGSCPQTIITGHYLVVRVMTIGAHCGFQHRDTYFLTCTLKKYELPIRLEPTSTQRDATVAKAEGPTLVIWGGNSTT